MSRLPLLAAVVTLACRGATPERGGDIDAGASQPLWPRTDAAGAEGLVCQEMTDLGYHFRPADVIVLFDRSESMITEFGTGTRYSVASMLLGGLADVYQDRLRFGLEPFPAPDPCDSAQSSGCCVADPTVPVGLDNAAAIAAGIAAAAPPTGSTPTALALRRARESYAALDDGIAERYVLLATDGRPSCDKFGRLAEDVIDTDGTRVLGPCRDALDEVDALVAAGVKVIVLSLGSGLADDPGGQPGCLGDLARHGAGPDARQEDRPWFYSATDPDGLERALQQIFGGTIPHSCVVQLDRAPPDPDAVSVYLDGHQVPRNRTFGWDYDMPDDPRQLRFFGDYCRRIDRFQVSAVEVRWGCPPCTMEGPPCQ